MLCANTVSLFFRGQLFNDCYIIDTLDSSCYSNNSYFCSLTFSLKWLQICDLLNNHWFFYNHTIIIQPAFSPLGAGSLGHLYAWIFVVISSPCDIEASLTTTLTAFEDASQLPSNSLQPPSGSLLYLFHGVL